MIDDIPSPCIHICTVDTDSGYCMGCSRTQDEIEKWGNPNTTNEWKENNLFSIVTKWCLFALNCKAVRG